MKNAENEVYARNFRISCPRRRTPEVDKLFIKLLSLLVFSKMFPGICGNGNSGERSGLQKLKLNCRKMLMVKLQFYIPFVTKSPIREENGNATFLSQMSYSVNSDR